MVKKGKKGILENGEVGREGVFDVKESAGEGRRTVFLLAMILSALSP